MKEWTGDYWHSIFVLLILELIGIVPSVMFDAVSFLFVVPNSLENTSGRRINLLVNFEPCIILIKWFNSVTISTSSTS